MSTLNVGFCYYQKCFESKSCLNSISSLIRRKKTQKMIHQVGSTYDSQKIVSIFNKFFFAAHLLNTETEAEHKPEPINKCDECFEVVPTEEQEKGDYFAPDLVSTLNRISFGNKHKIYHVPVENIIDQLIEKYDDISCAEQHHSDLVAGIYEGEEYSWNFISWLNIFLGKCSKCDQ